MSGRHFEQIAASDPMVTLAPDDADQAFTAGVQFARALAGADSASFVMALGEQEVLIRSAIVEAGFPQAKARTTGELFEAGARHEWRRIASPERPAVLGTA